MKSNVSLERLRSLLDFDPETGVFKWKVARCNVKAGDVAGSVSLHNGYIELRIDRKLYLGHRLAWLYVHGTWPESQIDHRNKVRSDNRIKNLRPASRCQNAQNTKTPITNTSGYRGVSWHNQSGKWQVTLIANKRRKFLGLFADKEEGAIAYNNEAKRQCGEFYYEA